MSTRFIAVEGPIGVGKTTLARLLARHHEAELIEDSDADNPYLADFYANPAALALPTQLHFLVSRLNSLERLQAVRRERPVVADFMLDKDRLFAELTLDEHAWWIYSELHRRVAENAPAPDLVIYLQAPLERLVQRIERRGIAHEQRIDSHYLEQLARAYARHFHHYDAGALLIVNTDAINLVDSVGDRERLLQCIDDIEGGRHYFNPAAAPEQV